MTMEKVLAAFMSVVLAAGICPSPAFAGDLAAAEAGTAALVAQTTYDNAFTFTDSAVTASGESGCKIEGTALTVNAAGTYLITGSCTDGSIKVKKGTTGVTLVLKGLALASTSSAPLLVNSGCGDVSVIVEGDVALTDKETDATEDAEGAAVKVKKESSVAITGTGTLTADGSAFKNAIKGGATSVITIGQSASDTLAVVAKAAKNGIASDGAVIVNGGTVTVDATNDGIKSSPEADDTASEGTITVNGGTLNITAGDEGIVAEPDDSTAATNTTAKSTITVNGGAIDVTTTGGDGIRANGDIAISKGTFTIDAAHDGIQTNADLNIADGTFSIKTGSGYSTSKYTGDTSCKGLKANYSSDDSNTSKDTLAATNALNVTGGTFTLNTLDDAVHSDAYCTITGGTFTIDTGDDGIHADTTLTLGTSGGYARDPEITINHSYEGLEAGSLFAYSGKFYVVASDDGLNAAGGSTGDAQGPGGQDGFNPGGTPGQGGRGSQFPGGQPGQMWPMSTDGQLATAASGSYQIDIEGGAFYVNCDGDGLDSNGALYLRGGQLTVFSQSRGDNSAIDADGTISISGATVFTAGATGVDGTASPNWFASGQGYKAQSGNFNAGAIVNATSGSSVVYSDTLPKAASYVMYSAPNTNSGALSIATGTSVVKGVTNAWNHDWTGTVTKAATETEPGIITYSCPDLTTAELKTIPATSATTSTGTGTGGSTDDGSGSTETDPGNTTTGDDADNGQQADGQAVDISQCEVKVANSVYTGSAITPKATVTYNGATLVQDTHFTVICTRKVAGKATATITGIDAAGYTGQTTASFVIKPAKVTGLKVKSTQAGKVTVTWSKAKAVAAKASGYKIQCKVGSKTRAVTVKSVSTAKKVIANLAKSKKVKVRICAYKGSYTGAWSAYKAVTVKK